MKAKHNLGYSKRFYEAQSKNYFFIYQKGISKTVLMLLDLTTPTKLPRNHVIGCIPSPNYSGSSKMSIHYSIHNFVMNKILVKTNY